MGNILCNHRLSIPVFSHSLQQDDCYTAGMRVSKRIAIALLIGFLLGIVWFVGYRLITFKDTRTHYHANFAVYINGRREPFRSFTFYEEVQSCGADGAHNPKTRVHMHDSVDHVVHVHDPASTWGHFFANLGFALDDDLLKTDEGVFVHGVDDNQLQFILNGKSTRTLANEPIRSEDTLLISYGKQRDRELQTQYQAIKRDAATYNRRSDPSACTGTQELGLVDKLRNVLGIDT